MALSIFTDGGSRGNPGEAAVGFLIKDEAEKLLVQKGGRIGVATNNAAEYQAVVKALEWLAENNFLKKDINFFSDSMLMVNQLSGLWKIKDEQIKKTILIIRRLEAQINRPIKYYYIPREKNYLADKLVNLSLDNKIAVENRL